MVEHRLQGDRKNGIGLVDDDSGLNSSNCILICSDLDRTLLPNGSQVESPNARTVFARLVSHPGVTLAYVSGRHLELILDAITEFQLPRPEWVIGDVGTSIYRATGGQWQYWAEWERDIAIDWRGLRAKDLQPMFSDLPALRLQEQMRQNRFKLSYYVSVQADSDALLQEMTRRLDARDIKASLIRSGDQSAPDVMLDVLPACATKLHAIEFLMRSNGFDVGNTVFAGDSGNDLAVVASPIPSVLVANADSQVVDQARVLAERYGTQAALYLAKGGVLGMNGNYAAGAVEGILHYHPDLLYWLEAEHE